MTLKEHTKTISKRESKVYKKKKGLNLQVYINKKKKRKRE